EAVGRYLECPARVRQAMQLVEDDDATAGLRPVEKLRILESPLHGGEVAVEVNRIREHACEGCLPYPPDTGQPDDGALPPGRTDALEPECANDHGNVFIIWSSK